MPGEQSIINPNAFQREPASSPESQFPQDGDQKQFQVQAPSINLPKGGGAIRGMGEKFAANPVTGTGSTTVPIATSPGRSAFGPQLSLSYDSGASNGPFGFGWNLSLPSITRKTDKGLPRYRDAEESDEFILSGAEDLVPVLKQQGNDWVPEDVPDRTIGSETYRIKRYRPRIEGLFARIERWTNQSDPADTFWRSISKDNINTWYGKTEESRIVDPEHGDHIFSWLICESHDDKGNVIAYKYIKEDSAGVDLTKAHEGNRTANTRKSNRYLKRIRYGNHSPYFPVLSDAQPWPTPPGDGQWYFEVVLDFGEHDPDNPTPDDAGQWLVRNDPFSSYRAGFEVRTYRLCQRVLMFHHFPAEAEVGADCLVRSTDFTYSYEEKPEDARNPIYSKILSVSQSRYKRKSAGGYLKKSLPPLEFVYTEAAIQHEVKEVEDESLENLPQGLDGDLYQWVDLDGEGLSGILTDQGGAWYYKRNLSPLPPDDEQGGASLRARFAPLEKVGTLPSTAGMSSGVRQFLDLAGDGHLDAVALESPTPGFFERTLEGGWEPFKSFRSIPSLAWSDPNLKFVDLTGDGHAEVLITEDEVLTWHPSLAESGFGPAKKVRQTIDEEKGPRLVFADGTQSIYLSDMSGDGLTDLARIRNGEVCYWPNLGYGRFGPKVSMDNAPLFDAPDMFDQKRIRLADIDGSGTTDILYLGGDRIDIYRNQSGNSWSTAEPLTHFPKTDNLSTVMAVDLMGNGTACLVWSSPLPGDASRPMRYIDLMGGQKPHLLFRMINNLGAETRVHYAPSTKFYLQDKHDGKPWITRLPFPVHVVERVATYDWISRNRFVTRYAYHHGYFDGQEREYRGFGMVEQWDTEEYATLSQSQDFPRGDNMEESSHVPPVHTKTWFLTGAYLKRYRISNYFESEYYREPGLDDQQARELLLEDTILPDDLSIDEEREACRALKGQMLRQEVYALDGTDKEPHPYTVTEQNFTIRYVQPKGDNRHGAFFTHAREVINYHYERNPSDPRIAHAMTLEVDAFGNVLKSASIGYGRRNRVRVVDDQGNVSLISNPNLNTLDQHDQAKQTQTLITYTENRVTNSIDVDSNYRTPLPSETRTYELTGYSSTGVAGRFQFSDFVQPDPVDLSGRRQLHIFDGEVDYEDTPPNGRQRRLIEHLRTLYRPDDLGIALNDPLALLPFETVEPLALPGETYKLAFTSGLLTQVYQRPREGQTPENLLPNPNAVLPVDLSAGRFADRGGYVDLDNDGHWWIPSGQSFFTTNPLDAADTELAQARQHFFLPRRYRDLFGQNAFVDFDAKDLLMTETRDALGNRVTVNVNDYRVLQPRLVSDPNRNRTEVAFDTLGMVVGTSVMGKPLPAPVEGDTLTGFVADLTQTQLDAFFDAADPHATAPGLLRDATTRIVYDLDRFRRTRQANPNDLTKWQPACAATLARETHINSPLPPQGLRIQLSFSYSDGFGREIQKKIQAESGPVPQRDANGIIIVGADGQPVMTPNEVSPRWVGSGWTVFNNKGKPVRQYEPFFTDTYRYEFDAKIGVSPVLFYDPVERMVATLHPNHAWEKVVFDPWRQETWDVSDTVLIADPKTDADVGDFFGRMPSEDYLPTWHALRTDAAHAADFTARYPDESDRTNETLAAEKTLVHAETPTVAHADSLGRTCLTIAHNKAKYSDTPATAPPVEKYHSTRIILDIEGNQREVIDAKDRIIMRYDYDMLGNRVHQASMEAGERWMLNDVAGRPLYAWDSRHYRFRTAYDLLRRPSDSLLREDGSTEIVVGRTIYGETQPSPEDKNLRGKLVQLFDQAGVVTSEDYDFKGNLLSSERKLVDTVQKNGQPEPAYKTTVDWNGNYTLKPENYTSRTRYDALNRPTQLVVSHSDQPGTKINMIQLAYNDANLLEKVDAWLNRNAEPGDLLDPATASLHAVTDIDYDAKGQRILIDYGTSDGKVIRTRYTYDPKTFRLTHLYTRRGVDPATGQGMSFTDDCDNPQPPPPTIAAPDEAPQGKSCGLQNLHYTYDPAGNITHIRDEAQQTIYFRNTRVEPSADYTYDAIFRLIEATGREHLGQVGGPPVPHSYNDAPRVGLLHPGDGNAMGTYLERYIYDAVGNFLEMQHCGSSPANPGWTRNYSYNDPSLLQLGKQSNWLSSTTLGGVTASYSTAGDGYDPHGNMLRMPQLQVMQWNFNDQLQMTQRQAVNPADADGVQRQGERTWYTYDASGERIRKVRELGNGQVKDERLYLGGFEIYRKHGANALVRETLHIMDDKQRIALVETRTQGNEPGVPQQLIRYQFGNHLGSSSLELDEQAQIISYEEYTPNGSTSYQAVRSQTETPKRYRYTGKERDEESGLYYHGARYYAPWLGRWTSCDPAGVSDHVNLFVYVKNNPIRYIDDSGRDPTDTAVSVSPRLVEALEAANRADFDDASMSRLLEVVDQEIRSRGFSYYFTRDAALAHALIRAEAYNRHRQLGNYGRATFHATLGVIDSFGYALYGDSAGETARNVGIAMAVGAVLSRLAAAGRAAQLETQASTEALAARVASRRASPPPASEPPSTYSQPPAETPATRPPPPVERAPASQRGAPSASRLINRSVPGERYFVQDPASPRFYAEGIVSRRGELSISLRTQLKTGQRSILLRGAEQFQAILRFFQGRFTSIKGNWQFGTNLARFNELTARGLSPAEAAAGTWTGQQAAAAGFRTVRIQNLQGSPGNYTSVQVLFTQ